jgi:lipid II:glycine glycyltransferase (peptidoglycan interpeptide bridge formation enzyme)
MIVSQSALAPNEWDHFVKENALIDGFWYYSTWIDFQLAIGKRIEKYSIISNNEVLGIFFIEYNIRRLARYGYIPGGFIIKRGKEIPVNVLKVFLKNISRIHRLFTIRLDSLSPANKPIGDIFQVEFSKSFATGLPRYWGVIDLTNEKQKLWQNISASSKNNINKGNRQNFEIVKTDDVDLFFKLLSETSASKNFLIHDNKYFQKQFEIIDRKNLDIYICKKDAKLLCAAWINKSNTSVFYTHGASTCDPLLSKYRAQYYLQWFLIQKYKSEGYTEYNMWGILKDSLTIQAMNGVSDFKKNIGAKLKYENTLLEFRYDTKSILQVIYDFFVYRKDRY